MHQPAFSAPLLYPGKIVVTINDLIAMFIGEDIPFISRQYFGRWMPLTHKRADHIIAISEHTKKDVISLLKIPENKITVIHLAANENFKPERDKNKLDKIKKKFYTGDHFFLHIGTITPRKNLEFIVRAFSDLAKNENDCKLVIAGKKGWFYEKLNEIVEKLGLVNHVIFTGYITEEEKILLYNASIALVFPSIYEGFGFPPLEAMNCGAPVIASHASSIPEVVGEAGILLDPNDQYAWAQAMKQVMTLGSLRKKMISDGFKQAKKFSWKKTAEKTVRVYEQVYKVER
ncbi:MAG: group 1 glycosyl transferase [Candidatus Berkelbacteria bacterium Licking1014_85]|uniref:Group 1 glycosyl transferase n=1 Tax=Candidatus Berkelbacteria bacterium Licking1014_85 TaxID=2017148 RepID=A0A554LG88_9BACT|nr:MAG: group 1 glycosyl transferase [Candidatus Berkelbacteria bacterium Licking1014_85]